MPPLVAQIRAAHAATPGMGHSSNYGCRTNETSTVPLGICHGLAFGLMPLPHGGMDAYLDGQVTRRTELRGSAGVRAVRDAVERLASGYGVEIERGRQDRAVADVQIRVFKEGWGPCSRTPKSSGS